MKLSFKRDFKVFQLDSTIDLRNKATIVGDDINSSVDGLLIIYELLYDLLAEFFLEVFAAQVLDYLTACFLNQLK